MKKDPALTVVIIIVILSLFIPLAINYETQSKIYGSSNLSTYISLTDLDNIPTTQITSYIKNTNKFQLDNDLGLVDGITNGMIVIGHGIRNAITGTITDFINGFSNKTKEMQGVWLFFGVFLCAIKNIVLSVIYTVVIGFMLFIQSATYIYYLGYILTILFIFGMFSMIKNGIK